MHLFDTFFFIQRMDTKALSKHSASQSRDSATVGHVISSARGEESSATTSECHEFQIFRREPAKIKDTIQLKVFHWRLLKEFAWNVRFARWIWCRRRDGMGEDVSAHEEITLSMNVTAVHSHKTFLKNETHIILKYAWY